MVKTAIDNNIYATGDLHMAESISDIKSKFNNLKYDEFQGFVDAYSGDTRSGVIQ